MKNTGKLDRGIQKVNTKVELWTGGHPNIQLDDGHGLQDSEDDLALGNHGSHSNHFSAHT